MTTDGVGRGPASNRGASVSPRPGTRGAVADGVRRIVALGRAEALLLRRNAVALLVALTTPAATMFMITSSSESGAVEGFDAAASAVTGLAAIALLAAVYYNLVTALVARREELVLKRLRAGEASDSEIVIGTALPAVAVAWAQIVLGSVAAYALFGTAVPVNVLPALAAVVLGTAVFVLLAALSTVVTRSVEMAQVTTMPVLIVPLALCGLFFPLDDLPGPLEQVARMLPLTPVVDLMRLGLTGTTTDGRTVELAGSFGEAAGPVLVLVAWVALGGWAARRWFQWEPRR